MYCYYSSRTYTSPRNMRHEQLRNPYIFTHYDWIVNKMLKSNYIIQLHFNNYLSIQLRLMNLLFRIVSI